MVTLTDNAAEKVKELLNGQSEEQTGLRVAVRGGGCSGFQYALAFDEQREGDKVYEYQEIRLLIDSQSLPFVDGSQVDYVESLQGAGFQVQNPNVVAACGCGQSFRTA
jgi:iron-sulfur cluster assembly protein